MTPRADTLACATDIEVVWPAILAAARAGAVDTVGDIIRNDPAFVLSVRHLSERTQARGGESLSRHFPHLTNAHVRNLLHARVASERGQAGDCETQLAQLDPDAVPAAWYAWARGKQAIPLLDEAFALQASAGEWLTWQVEQVATRSWHAAVDATDPDAHLALIVALGERWREAARDAHPDGWLWANSSGWDEGLTPTHLTAARRAQIPSIEDNRVALTLWRAAWVIEPTEQEAERTGQDRWQRIDDLADADRWDIERILDHARYVPHLPQVARDELPRPAALLYGQYAPVRLAVARGALRTDADAMRLRLRYARDMAGELAQLHMLPFVDPPATPEAFFGLARRALAHPDAYGDDGAPGRELAIPVTYDCFTALHARYGAHAACEGLRALVSSVRANTGQAHHFLALTFAHADTRGPRRVSAVNFTHPDGVGLLETECTLEWVAERARVLGGAVGAPERWDARTDGHYRDDEYLDTLYGEPSAPRADAHTRLFVTPCAHARRRWEVVAPVGTATLVCAACGAELVRGHGWQVPELIGPHRAVFDDADAHRLAQSWAILHDLDPTTVPDTITALQARDGLIDARLRARRAPGSVRSLRDSLGGRR